jgi:hypothetical protein
MKKKANHRKTTKEKFKNLKSQTYDSNPKSLKP